MNALEGNELWSLYKLAIEARKNHYENYEKWMTFYYISVGAILVAYYQIESSIFHSFFLPLTGFVVSIFWHLSCKGFKYWTDSWITIVWKYETQLQESFSETKLYSLFSKEVYLKSKKSSSLVGGADISTPKITLLFSFIVCCIWMFLFLRELIVLTIFLYLTSAFICHLDLIKSLLYFLSFLSSVVLTSVVVWVFLKSDRLKNHPEDTHELFPIGNKELN